MINIINNKYVQYASFVTFLIVVILVYIWNVSRLPTKMELYVFDTKGDPSIFIRTPDDVRILIDGGGNSEIIREITKILPFYSRRIDDVIVTSDSGDDVTGLIDVVNRYKVGQIILPVITAKESGFYSTTDKIYETFIDIVNQLNVPIERVGRGDVIDLGGLKFDVFFPEINSEFKYSIASPPEMVLRLNYFDTRFLLIGNASLKVQKYIASSSIISSSFSSLKSDVLIVPHNVSNSSLSTNLINVVKPEFVIYSQATSNSRDESRPSNLNSSANRIDPLYMILGSNRFNIKSKNTIKVLSDGKSVKIE